MPDALLDTTFFIDLHHGDGGARQVWGRIDAGGITASYSVITVFELWVSKGIPRSEELFYESVFERLEIVSLSESASRRAALWVRNIRSSVREALSRDALITATAVERGEAVYTRNVRDFQRFIPNTVRY